MPRLPARDAILLATSDCDRRGLDFIRAFAERDRGRERERPRPAMHAFKVGEDWGVWWFTFFFEQKNYNIWLGWPVFCVGGKRLEWEVGGCPLFRARNPPMTEYIPSLSLCFSLFGP